MNPERYQQIDRLVDAALELYVSERATFLDQACAGDEELRQQVERLLAAHEREASFLTSPALEATAKEMAQAQDYSLPIGRKLGHYQILSLLGAGGMGEVYLAEDSRLDRKVAVKLLPPEFTRDPDRVRRFVREAKAASALNHPNIITIHDIGESDVGRFIVMELVEGRTLRKLDKPCPPEQLINLGRQIAKALSAAHAAGITHRDIKPDNIMLRDDGYAKVLDFGLARLIPMTASDSDAEISATRTQAGAVFGTAAYMSPEQARGAEANPASDIFALGIVLYELATAQHPFKAETTVGCLHSITSQTPPPLSRFITDLPAGLGSLILRMLEKDASQRPAAQEVDRALGEIAGERSSGRLYHSAKPVVERRIVGREKERAELRAGFESALAGRGRLLCVAGEPGIGKTTLVEDFLTELAAEGRCAIARGRCSERLAGTEAYLPLLEALDSLLQSGSNPGAARVLKQIAPAWHAQLVSQTGGDEELAPAPGEVKAASQERMKRELGAFLQEVARLRPLVLFFDDLHWADVSTIDMLSFLAGRFDTLNALIVTTYRPSDMLLSKHPFLQIKPDLQARRACREMALEFLSEAEIAEYLALEFPGHNFPADFAKLIHAKTEGSPLFMADLARYLRDRGVIALEESRQGAGAPRWTLAQALPDIEVELPESARGMIERKIAQLSEEDRRLLTVASVQGYAFDSAVVAQVAGVEVGEIEERLEKLERVNAFVKLVEEREFPDGALSLRYRFVHALYQNALYNPLRGRRKASLSAAVAQAVEKSYGEQRASEAIELAALWEAAREYARAAEYYQVAARRATRVLANREAAALAQRGLEMIGRMPGCPERDELEISLRLVLSDALIATKGFAAPEVEQTYSRIHKLGQMLGATRRLLPALRGLCAFYLAKGRYRKALAHGEELLNLAEQMQDPAVVFGHNNMGMALFALGEIEQAREHLRQSLSLYTEGQHRRLTWLYVIEPGMQAEVFLSYVLWLAGYPDQALAHGLESLRLGKEVSHANSRAYALANVAFAYINRGDWRRARDLAEESVAFSAEQGLPFWLGHSMIAHGRAIVGMGEVAEGIVVMRRGIAALRSTGAEIGLTRILSALAEAYWLAKMPGEGLTALEEAEALAKKNEERFYEAELFRLKGELSLDAGGDTAEAEALFQKALEIARRQQAKSLELRAAMSLARLWRRQGKSAEARQTLTGIYGWFREGFGGADLQDAKALIAELS